ncbi:MAG: RT0821/Lpp0805 family surface protein [Alphaproteobacteria bacterium]
MRRTSNFSRSKRMAVAALILVCGAVWSAPASAEPPPWAPAWGHRANKNKHRIQQAYVPPYDIGLGRCNRDLIGGLLGGAAGGLIGSQIGKGKGQLAAAAAGALLGFLAGNTIGRSMDEADQSCLTQTLEHGEDGQEIAWENPDSGASYQITPTKTIPMTENRYCREYTSTATIGGKTETTYGRACRQPDGAWQIEG